MHLEARHVKRKQLCQYLAPSIFKRERKSSGTSTKPDNRKRTSSEAASEADAPNKKSRLSEEIAANVSILLRR